MTKSHAREEPLGHAKMEKGGRFGFLEFVEKTGIRFDGFPSKHLDTLCISQLATCSAETDCGYGALAGST